MTRYLLTRTLSGMAVLLGLITVAFFATHYIGDPVFLLVDRELSTEADRQALVQAGGFDRPVWEQYTDFLTSAVRGDFGTSIWQHRAASDVVLERMPATLMLTLGAVLFTFAVSVPAAIFGAIHAGRWPETLITTVATALASVTSFWFALALIFVLAVRMPLLPTSGYGWWPELLLPVLALSAPAIGHTTQILQSSLAAEFGQNYVRTARAKGLRERTIARRHVLRNGGIVLVTMLGGMIAVLMNGTVLIESIFAWPGIGQVSLQAIQRRDLPVLMAAVFYLGVLITVLNVLVDLIYVQLDPRIRLR